MKTFGLAVRAIALGTAFWVCTLGFPVSIATQRSSSPLQIISSVLTVAPAQAQRVNYRDVAQQVYREMPNLPLENQYVDAQSGDVATDNTLVARLLRYHLYIKVRPPNYRLDWKLTLADYLGANEWVQADLYPSANSLETNPRDGDIDAIERLTRDQRNALIQILVDIYNDPSRLQTHHPSAATTATLPSGTSSQAHFTRTPIAP